MRKTKRIQRGGVLYRLVYYGGQIGRVQAFDADLYAQGNPEPIASTRSIQNSFRTEAQVINWGRLVASTAGGGV
jgi:hypothetical protein